MSTLAFRVIDMRIGPFGPVQAFFNVAFGVEDADGNFTGLFTVRDFALKTTKDGGYWFQSPDKIRLDKNKQPVMGDDGYPKRDEYFEPYKEAGAGKEGRYGTTKAAWSFKDSLLKGIVEEYKDLATSGQVSKPARTAQPPKAKVAAAAEAPSGSPLGEEDEPWF